MGTKTNPGEYDCHAAAAPDEPLFTLLARDPLAPALVRMWVELRALSREPTPREHQKRHEAMACAEEMTAWRKKSSVDADPGDAADADVPRAPFSGASHAAPVVGVVVRAKDLLGLTVDPSGPVPGGVDEIATSEVAKAASSRGHSGYRLRPVEGDIAVLSEVETGMGVERALAFEGGKWRQRPAGWRSE